MLYILINGNNGKLGLRQLLSQTDYLGKKNIRYIFSGDICTVVLEIKVLNKHLLNYNFIRFYFVINYNKYCCIPFYM